MLDQARELIFENGLMRVWIFANDLRTETGVFISGKGITGSKNIKMTILHVLFLNIWDELTNIFYLCYLHIGI